MLLARMAILLISLNWLLGESFCPAADPQRSVRVMSFNIRYGTAADGKNKWDLRKEFLVDTIEAFNPDLMGTQETLGFQRDYLAHELPAYDHFGVGRNDGKEDGEMMALYYCKDRFDKVDGGHFWLSEFPDKPGSVSWDSSLPRMATWVKLHDRNQPDAASIVFFNTHFDHRGNVARVESAKLLRQRAADALKSGSLIITGDFNSGENTAPYHALFNPVDQQPSPVVDSFRAIHKTRAPDDGTFSGFSAAATGGARIDWIAVSRDWKVLQAGIDRTEREGVTPSDHFPVTAVLQR